MVRLCISLLPVSLVFLSTLAFSDDFTVPLNRTSGATYSVDAKVEGYDGKVKMMLDTGAAYSTLSNEVIKSLIKNGKAVRTGELTARLANGDYCPLYTYKISSLAIGEDCMLRNVEVAVTSNNSRNLLGLSTLQHTAPFTIAFNPDAALKLGRCDDTTYGHSEVTMNTQ